MSPTLRRGSRFDAVTVGFGFAPRSEIRPKRWETRNDKTDVDIKGAPKNYECDIVESAAA
ncbi:hypothetical protein ACHAPU_007113 [Fusarium lateritium]